MAHEWNVGIDEPRVLRAVRRVLGRSVGVTTMSGVYRGNYIEHTFTTCDLLELAEELKQWPVHDVEEFYKEVPA